MPARLRLPCGPGWKTCSKCGEGWLLFMFRSRPESSDGHRQDCIECTRKRDRDYNARNPDRVKRSSKPKPKTPAQLEEEAYERRVWRALNPDKAKEIRNRHYRNNREAILERTAQQRRDYYHNNKATFLAQQRIYQKRRRDTDPAYRMELLLRARINRAIKNGVKSARAMELVGCDVETLQAHFISLFTDGMTMEAFMCGEIHIDHKIPCSAFDLEDPEQQRRCFHYTNLQPMWAADNLRKSDKVITEHGSNPESSGQPVSARIYRGKTGRAVAGDGPVAPFEPQDSASSLETEQSKAA